MLFEFVMWTIIILGLIALFFIATFPIWLVLILSSKPKFTQVRPRPVNNTHEERRTLDRSVYDDNEDMDSEIEDDGLVGHDLFGPDW